MNIFKIIITVLCGIGLFVGGYTCGNYNTKPGINYLNMDAVTDFEATEHGVLLHTEDGNGYFIAR